MNKLSYRQGITSLNFVEDPNIFFIHKFLFISRFLNHFSRYSFQYGSIYLFYIYLLINNIYFLQLSEIIKDSNSISMTNVDCIEIYVFNIN